MNILRMSDICHLDVRIKVLLQNLLEDFRIEAEPNPWFGEDSILHPKIQLEYLA